MRLLVIWLLLLLSQAISFAQEHPSINRIETHLNKLSKDKNFSLAISKENSIILEKAFGYANREHQVLNTKDSRFNIASIGKMFTAVSILQLVEQNVVELDKIIKVLHAL